MESTPPTKSYFVTAGAILRSVVSLFSYGFGVNWAYAEILYLEHKAAGSELKFLHVGVLSVIKIDFLLLSFSIWRLGYVLVETCREIIARSANRTFSLYQ